MSTTLIKRCLKNIWRGMIEENPVFVLALGFCSTLAVTSSMKNAFFLAVIVGITTILTSMTVSFFRFKIPGRFRLMAYMLIIVTIVITAEQLLKFFYPDVAHGLGAYVGLIVTNCIVMGRMEAYASFHGPLDAFCDAVGVSLGYMLVLLVISGFREVLGKGTFWNISIMPEWFVPCKIFSSPPGAFIAFSLLLFFINWIKSRGKGN